MDILIKPLVTEKMTQQTERFSRYGFMVDRKATKPQIKKAVEGLYNVTVANVNTLVHGGKDICLAKCLSVGLVNHFGRTVGCKNE
jgi:large subunit ribosomal protein L23